MRRLGLVLLALALPAVAHADRHRMDARAAAQGAFRSSIWGLGLGAEWPIHGARCFELGPDGKSDTADDKEIPSRTGTLSILVEGSVTTGIHEGEHLAQLVGMGGLRYTLNKTRFQPYVHSLVGPGMEQRGTEEKWIGSASIGAGIQIPLDASAHAQKEGPESYEWLFFLQGDYYVTFAKHQSTDGYAQISAGFTVRLPHKKNKMCDPPLKP